MLKFILTVLVLIVIGGVAIIGLISILVLGATAAIVFEEWRMNREKRNRPPRLSAWRKRSIEDRE